MKAFSLSQCKLIILTQQAFTMITFVVVVVILMTITIILLL